MFSLLIGPPTYPKAQRSLALLPIWVLSAALLLPILTLRPYLAVLATAAIWFVLLWLILEKRFAYLPIAFAIADAVSHFSKRLIFVLGEQPKFLYSAVVAVPHLLVASALLASAPTLLRRRLPRSGLFLFGFLSWSTLLTVLSSSGATWETRLAVIQQRLIPMVLYFLAIVLPPTALAPTAKVSAIISLLSVIYGVVQFFGGPTALDRVWAEHAYSYSLQAAKVHAYMHGSAEDFRAFSFYADPVTWGFFLVAVFVLVQIAGTLGSLSRSWIRTTAVLTAAGLFVGLTRTPWVAFGVTIGFFGLLAKVAAARRPSVVFGLSVLAFWIVVSGGQKILDNWQHWRGSFVSHGRVITRYGTIGTLSARVGAIRSMLQLLSEKRLLGKGFGSSIPLGREYDELADPAADSHNVAVELFLYTGMIGFWAFCAFYWTWLREMFGILRSTVDIPSERCCFWLIAFSAGFIISGYLNGMTFMSGWFFYLMGLGLRVGLLRRPWQA